MAPRIVVLREGSVERTDSSEETGTENNAAMIWAWW
jgi:hypothetical protein